MKKDQEKKEKKLVKRAKKIRSMVMMILLCVLMLSAATYAWFTLSNTAKLTNLTMTVGDVTGLQIAEDNDRAPTADEWGSTLEGGTFKGKLLPATTTNGTAIQKPEYNDNGAVSSVVATTDSEKLMKTSADTDEGYWIERTFYLKALGPDGTTNIKLADGTEIGSNGIWVEDNKGNYNGTYVLSKVSSTEILPGAAVRMSFQKDEESTATVFEPNKDYNTPAPTKAIDNSGVTTVTSTITETMSGTCNGDKILTLTNNKATKITLRIWIEGTDAQCGNEIAAKDIISQLKFVTVEPTPAP